MDLLPHTQGLVRQFGEYYDCADHNDSNEQFYRIQSILEMYVRMFDKNWDYSLRLPDHLEMWQFITDHLIRWLTIPNVRYDPEKAQTTIDMLRCVARMNCSKKQFDGWVEVYKIMRFYTKNASIQLKSLSLFYNICLDENNKHTFITTKGIHALIHIFKHHMNDTTILSELLDLIGSLSSGRAAHYRWYSLQKSNIIPYILRVMWQHPLDRKIQNKACNVLHLLAYSEPMERQIVKLGGQELVCMALSNHGIRNATIAMHSLIKLLSSHEKFQEDRMYGIRFVFELFQRYATDLKMLNELVKLVNHLSTYHPAMMTTTTYDNRRLPSALAKRLVKDDGEYYDVPFDVKMIEEEIVKPPIVSAFENAFDEREHMYGEDDTHDAPYRPVRKSSLFILGVRAPAKPLVLSSLGETSHSHEENNDNNENNENNEDNNEKETDVKNIKNVIENPMNLVDVVIRLIGIVDDDIVFQAIFEMSKTSRVAYELVCHDVTRHVIRYSFANEELSMSILSRLISNFPLSVISDRECNIPDEIISLLTETGYDIFGILRTIFGREKGQPINESLHYSDQMIQFLILCGVTLSSDFRSRLSTRHEKLYQHVQRHFASNIQNILDETTTSIPTDINHLISQFVFY